MEITFRQRYPWALLPYKATNDPVAREEDALVYKEYFRWLRKEVVPPSCWLKSADEPIGWIVPSPADVHIAPVEDIEVDVEGGHRENFCQATGLHFLEDTVYVADLRTQATFTPTEANADFEAKVTRTIATRKQGSTRFYDANQGGVWADMFSSVGLGYFEWHLGWGVEVPDGYFLMIAPLPGPQDIEIPTAILNAAQLRRFNSTNGFALAMKPKRLVEVRRRQPIARVMLVHADTLRSKASFDGKTGE